MVTWGIAVFLHEAESATRIERWTLIPGLWLPRGARSESPMRDTPDGWWHASVYSPVTPGVGGLQPRNCKRDGHLKQADVIPAQAGIQVRCAGRFGTWIPAFAGMTVDGR